MFSAIVFVGLFFGSIVLAQDGHWLLGLDEALVASVLSLGFLCAEGR